MLPLFLGFAFGGTGVRMLVEHSSINSVLGGVLFVILGLVPLALLAGYLSRPVKPRARQ